MAKKQIAYMKTENGFRIVTVYEAIKRKNNLINNRDSELCFFDYPNEKIGELMFPKKTSKDGRKAHFSYFPNSTHSGIASETSITHTIYELAIQQTKKIKLYIFGEIIILYVKNAYPEYLVKTQNNRYYIDVYLELERTEPKSFYYKWGGHIAIEIYVTHKVGTSKAHDLELNRVQVCEVKIYDNERIPDDVDSEEEINKYVERVKKKVSDDKITGKMVNEVRPIKGTESEKRYLEVDQYEKDIMELRCTIKKYQNCIENKKENINSLKKQEKDLNEKIYNSQKILDVNYKKNLSIESLKQENQKLIEEKCKLENQVEKLTEDLNEEKNNGFLKKILKNSRK